MTAPATSGRPASAPEAGRLRRALRFRPARPWRLITALGVLAGLGMMTAGGCALLTARPPKTTQVDVGTLPVPATAGGHAAAVAPAAPAAPPVRIRIPGIGLDHPLIGLQVQQDGHLGVPEDPGQVGWWSDGPRPGDPGAAIVVGHVDSLTGPAAFYGLSTLRPGDPITVDRADHTHLDFTVRALRQYEKDAFPDDQVYATAGPPTLRLITCGGAYAGPEGGGYLDNVVVYATPADPNPPHPSPHATPKNPQRSGN
ncbi:class F sortase [Streptomyces sp. NPDC008139]|uniref:class F sortase n=1 Tax=Streptomyces sp. NPDC008139 TaxID=3364814 RepID=UPI0036E51095